LLRGTVSLRKAYLKEQTKTKATSHISSESNRRYLEKKAVRLGKSLWINFLDSKLGSAFQKPSSPHPIRLSKQFQPGALRTERSL
jgi:hypothetical protein